jgi:hypothetical protein
MALIRTGKFLHLDKKIPAVTRGDGGDFEQQPKTGIRQE